MPSAAELRTELREAMKTHKDYQPVSKMAKADVSALLQRLKVHTEETPSAGMMKDGSKKPRAKVEDVHRAKELEFPTAPSESKKASAKPKAEKKSTAKAEEKPKASGRPAKGSPEMAEKMAKLRAARGKK